LIAVSPPLTVTAGPDADEVCVRAGPAVVEDVCDALDEQAVTIAAVAPRLAARA
jgi:hypothetical protein